MTQPANTGVPAGGQDPAPTPAPVPAPPAPAPAPTPPAPPADPGSGGPTRDAAWLEAENRRLMAENARDRTAAKEAAKVEARKALLAELTGNDAPVDPATLAAQMQQTAAQRAELAAENAVLRAAPRFGADPDALADSTRFMGKVRKLDTSAADYPTLLENLIKETVAADPRLRLAGAPVPPPPPAGDPATAGAGQPAPGSPSGVEAMRKHLRPGRG